MKEKSIGFCGVSAKRRGYLISLVKVRDRLEDDDLDCKMDEF